MHYATNTMKYLSKVHYDSGGHLYNFETGGEGDCTLEGRRGAAADDGDGDHHPRNNNYNFLTFK